MVKNINGDIYSDLITSSRSELYGTNGSRELSSVRYIVIHGTASTNINNVFTSWSVADNNYATGRQASANYVVNDSQIVGCVGENASAWHCGGTGAITNQNSIGIEHVNSYIGNLNDASTYLFSEATINNGARLTAEICKRLGIVPSASTIVPHKAVYATACPQSLDMNDYIKRVQNYYNGNSNSSSTSTASKIIEKIGGKTNMILFQEGSKVFLWVGNQYTHIGDISELDSIKTMMAKAGYDTWIHTDAKQIKYIKKLATEAK
ncbi:MAG: N-acetylmuramoyl-L-alanine amidase [Streptococcaceae bacterium]|jgi:N-acetylmuramoyl-L-alanine amidase CwlA|nr:N-acetylmuramoyl-L-alanine amidase [Streptococcaceae bacterium]